MPIVWGSGSENSASVKGPGVRAQGIGKWAELQWSPGVWAERTQPSLESWGQGRGKVWCSREA